MPSQPPSSAQPPKPAKVVRTIKVNRHRLSPKQKRSRQELASRVAIHRAAGWSWEKISLDTGEPADRLMDLHDELLRNNLPQNVQAMVAAETHHLWYLTSLLVDDLQRSMDVRVTAELRELSAQRAKLLEMALGRSTTGGQHINVAYVGGGTAMEFGGRGSVPSILEADGSETEYLDTLKALDAVQRGEGD